MPPHDPPVDLPLTRRDVHAFLPPRPIFCPRPVVPLPVRVRHREATGNVFLPFIVDTGADVTMIPEHSARHLRLAGYDPAAVTVATGTSFHGQLRGKWGHVHTAVGARQLQLPCFYYTDSDLGGRRDVNPPVQNHTGGLTPRRPPVVPLCGPTDRGNGSHAHFISATTRNPMF